MCYGLGNSSDITIDFMRFVPRMFPNLSWKVVYKDWLCNNLHEFLTNDFHLLVQSVSWSWVVSSWSKPWRGWSYEFSFTSLIPLRVLYVADMFGCGPSKFEGYSVPLSWTHLSTSSHHRTFEVTSFFCLLPIAMKSDQSQVKQDWLSLQLSTYAELVPSR